MNEKMRLFRNNSIQTRLVAVTAGMLVVAMSVHLFIYIQINSMVRRIDAVFASNVTITELTGTLQTVQDQVYEYLNTKSSAALEDYYRYSEQYSTLISELNSKNADSQILMLEKNIRSMSETYLQTAEETVQAKRGRNVERYKALYEELDDLCGYINSYIGELNSRQFERNSDNYESLLSAMRVLELLSVGVIVVIFIICVVFITLIIRSMIRPLTALSEAASKVAHGDFDAQIPPVETEDEIGIVTNAFGQMLTSIRAYIGRLRTSMDTEARLKRRELEMEAHLKEAQLKFLQAQINPHFLFNSLNAGAQLAVMEDADATGEFLQKMADFFRYTVKNTNGNSSLEEEIVSVDNYIYILNVRFAGDILFEKNIPEELPWWEMPGMILQPLVENAVNHGIREMIDHGHIILAVELEEEMVRVTVRDNGVGMSREQIEKIMNGEFSHDDSRDSTGIGLGNVINRLRLYYDQEGLLQVRSEGKDQGTEVTVLLPAHKGSGTEMRTETKTE